MFRLDRSSLNPQQLEAVLHKEGPLLVLAGAGSGKTRVITQRIAHMISEGVPPESIVALSFTNKAAQEMKHRVAQLVGSQHAEKCRLSTFHSLGADILRRFAGRLGYRTPFAIIDQNEQRSILKDILRELRLAGPRADPDELIGVISQAKMAFCRPEELKSMRFNPGKRLYSKIFDAYEEALFSLNAVDFDDLIGLPVKIFDEHPDVLRRHHRRWRYLMVDEYQDTNHTQFELLERLVREHQNVVAVGDDDQSIYGFRGADSGHILSFADHFDGAKIVMLEQNYRSCGIILDAANAVIAVNTERHEKSLWSQKDRGVPIELCTAKDEKAEARLVANLIQRGRQGAGRPYRDSAVLFRVNPQARHFEEAFRELEIPYKIAGGTRFFDRPEVRDLLHFLRACESRHDELSIRRIVNLPPRGMGPANVKIVDEVARNEDMGFFLALEACVQRGLLVGRKAQRGAAHLVKTLNSHRDQLEAGESPTVVARSLMNDLQYELHLCNMTTKGETARRRVANVHAGIRALASFEARHPTPTLRGWLDRVSLDRSSNDDDEKDEVALMTFHSSKGLEFPVVYLVGCEEGLLPHERSTKAKEIAEERRLAYVGITRAKEKLVISHVSQRYVGGELLRRVPSRFLADIPDELTVRPDISDEALAEDRIKGIERKRQLLAELRAAIGDDP